MAGFPFEALIQSSAAVFYDHPGPVLRLCNVNCVALGAVLMTDGQMMSAVKCLAGLCFVLLGRLQEVFVTFRHVSLSHGDT